MNGQVVTHAAQLCPCCGTSHERSVGPSPAMPGALTLCAVCLAALRFAGPMWMERVDELTLPTAALLELEQLRAAVRAARNRKLQTGGAAWLL